MRIPGLALLLSPAEEREPDLNLDLELRQSCSLQVSICFE